jgi:HK97 family phage portal protein
MTLNMALWFRKKPRAEERASAENPAVPISSASILALFGMSGESAAGVNVTTENALGVPAIWAAVNFIAGTIAGLPLHVYKKSGDGREKVKGGLASILHDAVNDECSSFEWRKYSFERVLTGGRSLTFIERNEAGRVINLWPLNPAEVTVRRKNGKRLYELAQGDKRVIYAASEIIDIPFMLDADMLTARSPILTNRDTIGLAIAATQYGSKFFNNGGVPPFVMTGNFQTGAALNRASADLEDAVKKASREGRMALTLPAGHEIKSIGVDPTKSQLVELKRFLIEEMARIYSLPPNFLQDLTHGTFSNTEQQDLHLVKHTIKRWVEQVEQELNLKLFGRTSNNTYVEFNLDGLMRGDFKTRMEGYATAIQNGVLKPNEVRRQENRPDDPHGDALLIQGATVPLGTQPTSEPAPAKENNDGL